MTAEKAPGEKFWSDVAACDRLDDDFWFPDVLAAAECERALMELADERAERVARWGERYVRIMEEHEARESEMAKADEVLKVEVGFDPETRDLAQELIDSLEKARLGRDPLLGADPERIAAEVKAELLRFTAGTPESAYRVVKSLPWSLDEPGQRDATDGVLCDIGAERARQIAEKRYSLEHDDAWVDGELAQAGAAYAWPKGKSIGTEGIDDRENLWPFAYTMQSQSRRRELVKAAALLVAEIERLDRIEAP